MHVKLYVGINIRSCWKWPIVWHKVVDIKSALLLDAFPYLESKPLIG